MAIQTAECHSGFRIDARLLACLPHAHHPHPVVGPDLALDEFGADNFDIVYPPTSILAEPPVAVVDANVDAKGTRKVAEAYLSYLYSKEGQTIIAKNHYRPAKPELVPAEDLAKLPEIKLVSIDDPQFGGWKKAQPYHFGDGGIFDQIYKPAQ